MLQVAIDLLEQGNSVESDRVRKEAQTQRTVSTLLMAEAHNLERNRASVGLKTHSHRGRHTPFQSRFSH
jgi:hypothetical protein